MQCIDHCIRNPRPVPVARHWDFYRQAHASHFRDAEMQAGWLQPTKESMTMAAKKEETFVYTIKQRDSDAMNARSAAFRKVRDALELPTDDEGKRTQEAKDLHKAAADNARKIVNTVLGGITDRMKRKEWTDKITTKAHRLIAEAGVNAYAEHFEALGYEDATDDETIKAAMAEYEARIVTNAMAAKASWMVTKGTDFDEVFA